MKRNYKEDYTAELVFEMKDGTINYALAHRSVKKLDS